MSYLGTVSPTLSVEVAVAEIISGYLFDPLYWYEGLDSWKELVTEYIPPDKGTEINFAPGWVNDGNVAVMGHIDIEATSPTGVKHAPSAIDGQDQTKTPGHGKIVSFNSILLNEAGTWSLRVVLTCDGKLCDTKTYPFTVLEVVIESALTIGVSPTPPVDPGASLIFSGKLTRPDTGAGLAGQTVDLEQPPGTKVKSGTTDSVGNYSIAATAPTTAGTYMYRTVFEGTPGLTRAESRTLGVGIGVEVPTLTGLIVRSIIGAIVTAYSLG